MNAPSEDIKDFLEDEGSALGLVLGTNLFVGEMPETPDECVAVFDSGGEDPEHDYEYRRPTVQVRIRSEKGGQQAGWTLANEIYNLLKAQHNVEKNSTQYVGIWAQGDILSLGKDAIGRFQFSTNYRINRTTT